MAVATPKGNGPEEEEEQKKKALLCPNWLLLPKSGVENRDF